MSNDVAHGPFESTEKSIGFGAFWDGSRSWGAYS